MTPPETPWKFIATGNVARGFIAFGNVATGFIAVGNVAYGVVSVGLSLSVGVLALGVNAVGLVAGLGVNAVAPVALGAANALGGVAVAGANALGALPLGGVNTHPSATVGLVVAVVVLAASWLLPRIGPRPEELPQAPGALGRLGDVLSGRATRAWIEATFVALDGAGLRAVVAGEERTLPVAPEARIEAAALAPTAPCPAWLDVAAVDERGEAPTDAGYREAAPTRRAARVEGARAGAPAWLAVFAQVDGPARLTARVAAVATIAASLLAR